MIQLLPEPKRVVDALCSSKGFARLRLVSDDANLKKIARTRFWNYPAIFDDSPDGAMPIHLQLGLDGHTVDDAELFLNQGYCLEIQTDKILVRYAKKAGYINALTSLKMLLVEGNGEFYLPCCSLVDWPSVAVRSVAPTFSWYAGYGRIGFDSQLWDYGKWEEFLNINLDNKINQFNMVMYGYWPFAFDQYPETTLKDVGLSIWNAENDSYLKVRYTHPNIEDPFLDKLIAYGHEMEFSFFAYVGLNSYNGGYSIKHPQSRMIPPKTGSFLNDFDSLCLSKDENTKYILSSMEKIATLGFDGFSLEESEEGFWFCECETCKERWLDKATSPSEAKHAANIWLLNQIWDRIRSINPNAVLGIRAFRQPPLEKDPSFLMECVKTMPEGINLFWAPGLYVPKTEFPKWVNAFGKDHVWGRDSEANSITSTMGRLYRTFASNMIRYEDETNVQVIETDITQHIGSVEMGVHGINGFMFEWYGLFLHEFAHGNYGWGSKMDTDEFFQRACNLNFGHLGEKVLFVMRNMLTIHESQMPFYSTAFPFQKNKIQISDIPTIERAKENHPKIMALLDEIVLGCMTNSRLRCWTPHFKKLINAERRNRIIYDMVIASLQYEVERDPKKKDELLDEILYFNELDFDLVKQMFFDINPVEETGVKSCMYPYHEIKRLIHNIRQPENPDNNIICSGIEALGWLWL